MSGGGNGSALKGGHMDRNPHVHGQELGAEYGLYMWEQIFRLALACMGGFRCWFTTKWLAVLDAEVAVLMSLASKV